MIDIRISSLIKNAAVILVSLGLVASCSPNETGIVEDQPPASNDFDGGETIEILTTHWINSRDIGQGKGPITSQMLVESQSNYSDSWIQYGGDYANHRHSPIKALSPDNVKDLEFAWSLPTGTQGQFAVSPIVYDGIMYVTGLDPPTAGLSPGLL